MEPGLTDFSQGQKVSFLLDHIFIKLSGTTLTKKRHLF